MGTAAVAAAILLAGCGGETEEPVAEAPSPSPSATQEEEPSPSPTETSAAATTSSRATSTYRAPAPVEEAPAARETSEEEAEPEEPEASSGCDAAFASAAAVSDIEDAQEDLWPAFSDCADLAEFTAASELHPDALDGTDPETYATNQCLYEPTVAGTPVCEDVSGS